jgi:hypothetical protein
VSSEDQFIRASIELDRLFLNELAVRQARIRKTIHRSKEMVADSLETVRLFSEMNNSASA